MATNCVITFDHPNRVYNNGDTLNGHVRLQTEKPKSIRAITIKIIGYGKVAWSENRGGKNSTYFQAHENFLNTVNYVLGSPDGESFDLAPGVYDYTFRCDLPIQLPMTIKEDYGKIKYKVIVTIDRRLRFDNEFKQEFIVNGVLNLNWMVTNREPRINIQTMETRLPFRLCCYDSAKIKVELQVPCDGFVPGQQIPFQLIIYNDSNNDVSEAKVKFMKRLTYDGTEPYEAQKVDAKKLMEKCFNNIPRRTNREFKESFTVPFIPPTFQTKFIKLHYILRAKLRGYWMKKIFVDVPVTIGTIPISNNDPSKVSPNIPT